MLPLQFELSLSNDHIRLSVVSSLNKFIPYNPLIIIDIKLKPDKLHLDTFWSAIASKEEVYDLLTETEKHEYKGLPYACLCWLLGQLMRYGNYTMDTEISVTPYGYKYDMGDGDSMSKLMVYYGTMGFGFYAAREEEGPDGEPANVEYYVRPEIFSAIAKTKIDPDELTYEQFKTLSPNTTEAIFEESMRYISEGTDMNSSIGIIMRKCLQSQINHHKRDLYCQSGKVFITKLFANGRAYKGDLNGQLSGELRKFLDCDF